MLCLVSLIPQLGKSLVLSAGDAAAAVRDSLSLAGVHSFEREAENLGISLVERLDKFGEHEPVADDKEKRYVAL